MLVALASARKKESTGIIRSTEQTFFGCLSPPATYIQYIYLTYTTHARPRPCLDLDLTRHGLGWDKHLPSTFVAWLASYLFHIITHAQKQLPSFDSSCFVILSHTPSVWSSARAKSYLRYTLVDPRHPPPRSHPIPSHPSTLPVFARSHVLSTATPAVAVQPGASCPRPTRGRSDPSHRKRNPQTRQPLP